MSRIFVPRRLAFKICNARRRVVVAGHVLFDAVEGYHRDPLAPLISFSDAYVAASAFAFLFIRALV